MLRRSGVLLRRRESKSRRGTDALFPPKELAKFRAWYEAFDAAAWDQQITSDSNEGKLTNLATKALGEHSDGKTKPL